MFTIYQNWIFSIVVQISCLDTETHTHWGISPVFKVVVIGVNCVYLCVFYLLILQVHLKKLI